MHIQHAIGDVGDIDESAKSCRDKARPSEQQWAEAAVRAMGPVNFAHARLWSGQCIKSRKPLQRRYDGKMNVACNSSETNELSTWGH